MLFKVLAVGDVTGESVVLARHPPTLDNPARAASSPPPGHG